MVAHGVGAGHSAAHALLAHLVIELRRAVFVEHVVGIEVNRRLAHLAVIIGVQRVRHVRGDFLFEIVVKVVVEDPVCDDVGDETASCFLFEPALRLIAETHRVLVVKRIIHACRVIDRTVVYVEIRLLVHVPECVGRDIERDEVAMA